MKKIFLLLLISNLIFGQKVNHLFDQAFKEYNDFNYGAALKLFQQVKVNDKIDQRTKSISKFYIADCLLNLDQLDGAAIEFEEFIQDNFTSDLISSAYYKLGVIYNQKREYRKARERFFNLIKLFPFNENYGSSLYWLGESYLSENKFVDAEEYFKDAISNKRTNQFYVNSLYSLAQVYEKTNEFKKAIEYYDEILTYFKQSELAPLAQFRIGICYFNLGDYDNAILELSDNLTKLLDDEKQNEVKYFLAISHARLNELSDAKEILSQLINSAKDKNFLNRILFSKAWIDFQQNKYQDALTVFDSLYKVSNDTIKILSLFWSGECYRYLGNNKKADEIFKKFIDDYPEHKLASKAQLSRGVVFVNEANSKIAEESLQNAILSNDKQTKIKALILLGELRLNNNLFSEARRYFNEAKNLDFISQEVQNRINLGLGVSNYYLKNYSDAEKFLEQVIKNDKTFESDKVNFYLAEVYFYQGKYVAALKHYNLVKSNDKLINRQTLLGKAYTFFNSKDFRNSIDSFNDYITLYPNDKNINEIKLRLADSYFASKNFEKAASLYQQLILNDKNINNDNAFYQFAQSLFKAEKTDEAKKTFEELQVRFPKSKYVDESQYVIGWINFQQNKFDDAIYSYNLLLKKYPSSDLRPIVEYSIGDAYFNKGSYDSAIVYYSRVIENYPNSQYVFDAVNGIQYSFVALDQPERAISFIDEFIANNPNSKFSDQIYFKKGDLYYSLENYSDAVNSYKDFISRYPKSNLVSNAYYWIGKSSANLKNYNEAISNFNLSRSIAMKNDIGISSTVELVQIYFLTNNYSEANKILEETIALNSSSNRIPELLYLKGITENKSGNINDAVLTFEQVANYYSTSIFSSKSKIEIGKIELARNNFDKAQIYFKEIAENRLDDIGAEAQYNLGLVFFNQNKIEEAITQFVRTRSVFAAYDEWYTKSLLRLGDCFIKLNDKKQAREMFRAVLMRHTNDLFADEAKKKMKGL
ncbi:MAG: tetratricopeptide repeat protein [Melioribacteraceae bacterium]|nr:tetratricopeptide repeat protein [Melioribacteraceae bacterium]